MFANEKITKSNSGRLPHTPKPIKAACITDGPILYLKEKKTTTVYYTGLVDFHIALAVHRNTIGNKMVLKQDQLMLTNPRDVFRGQSRSPNMVPFDMLGMVSY